MNIALPSWWIQKQRGVMVEGFFLILLRRSGGPTQWHGYIDHILELITGIAMKDYE
jgi:hypothetical protein